MRKIAAVLLALTGCSSTSMGTSHSEYVTSAWDGVTPSYTISHDLYRMDDQYRVVTVPIVRAYVEAVSKEHLQGKKVAQETASKLAAIDVKELTGLRTCFMTSLAGETKQAVDLRNWKIELTDARSNVFPLAVFSMEGFWAQRNTRPIKSYYEYAKDLLLCSKTKADLNGKVQVSFTDLTTPKSTPIRLEWMFR